MFGMAVERGERRIEPGDAVVVEQQAHAYAALGRIPHLVEHQITGVSPCQM